MIETTLGAVRELHPIWQDAGQTDGDESLCAELDVIIGVDGDVYVNDGGYELSSEDTETALWAVANRSSLESDWFTCVSCGAYRKEDESIYCSDSDPGVGTYCAVCAEKHGLD